MIETSSRFSRVVRDEIDAESSKPNYHENANFLRKNAFMGAMPHPVHEQRDKITAGYLQAILFGEQSAANGLLSEQRPGMPLTSAIRKLMS